MRRSSIPLRSLPLVALLATACSVTPERTDYPALIDQELAQLPAWSATASAESPASLAQLIHSPQLDALVAEALAANPSLQQTALTLAIRRQERRQSEAARLPTVTGSMGASTDQEGSEGYSAGLSVSWEVDLWQRLAAGVAAADYDVAEQAALYRAARDSLAAEVMKGWLGLIAQRHAITIEQNRLTTLEQNEQFILQRYRNGLGSLEDLDSARSSTASSRATLEQYRETLAQRQRSLQGLLGRSTPLPPSVATDYPAVALPPADLPPQSLRRRPDLLAAYQAIAAAEARSAVAYRALLPSLDLSAALQSATSSPQMTLFTDPVWSLLAQLTAPLYQGGKLRAAAEIADLQGAQAYQGYRQTLITAVTEVGNGLGLEQSLGRRLHHTETALAAARSNLDHYQRSYRAGLATLLDLLAVERQTYDLEAQYDNLYYQQLTNRIDLGLALGLGVADAEGQAVAP